jgi:2-keto-4-pentenoate hydratase/2-oxohepta-3-ene-1,7-dioic acid hydratase in catechol pathway
VTFAASDGPHVGVLTGDTIEDLGSGDVGALITGMTPDRPSADNRQYQRSEVRLLAPIGRPGKVICAGINYRSHLDENPGAVMPKRPFFFSKLNSAVIGPDDPIVFPYDDCALDYEVELAVVVARRMQRVRAADALGHLFGFTILNDVSARDLQTAPDLQMTMGKGLDTFCPLGPVVVTQDELGPLGSLAVRSWVNGDLRQDGNTADWIFGVPELLEALTANITLEPGDVVSTGTPAGVALFRPNKDYMRPGDSVTVGVEGIGELTNPVVNRA